MTEKQSRRRAHGALYPNAKQARCKQRPLNHNAVNERRPLRRTLRSSRLEGEHYASADSYTKILISRTFPNF